MRQKIENTNYFRNLSASLKLIYSKRHTFLEIERHYNICKNLGIERWEREFKPNKVHRAVVLELIYEDEKN